MQFLILSKIQFILILSLLVYSSIFSQVEIKKTYYPNGKLQSEGEYLNGKKHGEYKEFYYNGTTWKEWNYSFGKEQGISTWYFDDGTISMIWNYIDGKA